MKKMNPKQKIILVIFGLFLSVVLLEIGLRLGGFIFLSLQEYRNIRSIKQKGEYRILCLGESTTADVANGNAWPRQLEEILNEQKINVKFSVINKGIAGTNTGIIVSKLEDYLNKYTPNMVITMMGINDGTDTILYEDAATKKFTLFLESLRTYKSVKLLWHQIINKTRELGIRNSDQSIANCASGLIQSSMYNNQVDFLEEQIKMSPHNYQAYIKLGMYYRDHGENVKARVIFKKAIKINPEDSDAYSGLGWCYRDHGESDKAEGMFKKAIDINPESIRAYAGLGWCYMARRESGRAIELFKKAIAITPVNICAYAELASCYIAIGENDNAIELCEKAIEINPENSWAYAGLGWCYSFTGRGEIDKAIAMYNKAIEINPENDMAYLCLGIYYNSVAEYDKAEEIFRKVIEINPENSWAYEQLEQCYKEQEKFDKAEEILKKAIDINPKNSWPYTKLSWCYRDQGEYDKAEGVLKEAIEIIPENVELYSALVQLYDKQGKNKSVEQYLGKLMGFRLKTYNPVTQHNYQNVKQIVTQRGIELVCVQYPMRKVEPLEKMLEPNGDIIFVDNEMVFKGTLGQSSYSELFTDMFAGDFGHCTRKGNRLLAENIANVILRECFNGSYQEYVKKIH